MYSLICKPIVKLHKKKTWIGSCEWTPVRRHNASHLRGQPLKQHGSLRVVELYRRRSRISRREAMKPKMAKGKKKTESLEMKNLKLLIKNHSIIQKNEKLREKALLLHQENAALLLLLKNKFSCGAKDEIVDH
ncbi:hypothetical protein CRG98_029947 [Punica granatum]|nr:hypothetical protein CRG98_029947 [Punica granatum]